jgi:hypothetical protein
VVSRLGQWAKRARSIVDVANASAHGQGQIHGHIPHVVVFEVLEHFSLYGVAERPVGAPLPGLGLSYSLTAGDTCISLHPTTQNFSQVVVADAVYVERVSAQNSLLTEKIVKLGLTQATRRSLNAVATGLCSKIPYEN